MDDDNLIQPDECNIWVIGDHTHPIFDWPNSGVVCTAIASGRAAPCPPGITKPLGPAMINLWSVLCSQQTPKPRVIKIY